MPSPTYPRRTLLRLPGVRTGTLGITALFFARFGLFHINAQYPQDVKGYSGSAHRRLRRGWTGRW